MDGKIIRIFRRNRQIWKQNNGLFTFYGRPSLSWFFESALYYSGGITHDADIFCCLLEWLHLYKWALLAQRLHFLLVYCSSIFTWTDPPTWILYYKASVWNFQMRFALNWQYCGVWIDPGNSLNPDWENNAHCPIAHHSDTPGLSSPNLVMLQLYS